MLEEPPERVRGGLVQLCELLHLLRDVGERRRHSAKRVRGSSAPGDAPSGAVPPSGAVQRPRPPRVELGLAKARTAWRRMRLFEPNPALGGFAQVTRRGDPVERGAGSKLRADVPKLAAQLVHARVDRRELSLEALVLRVARGELVVFRARVVDCQRGRRPDRVQPLRPRPDERSMVVRAGTPRQWREFPSSEERLDGVVELFDRLR